MLLLQKSKNKNFISHKKLIPKKAYTYVFNRFEEYTDLKVLDVVLYYIGLAHRDDGPSFGVQICEVHIVWQTLHVVRRQQLNLVASLRQDHLRNQLFNDHVIKDVIH